MLKNKSLWMKLAAVLVLSFSGLSSYAAADVRSAALGELVYGAEFRSLVELPAVPASAPEAVLSKAAAGSPAPGRDFTPKIEDASRIKSIMKLVTDIYKGVHLPYAQDGAVFSNKEGRLPVQPKGFYKEYTLLTGSAPHTVVIGGTTYQVAPDLSARGSERIIIGGGEKIYYTPDHYAHFILLTVVY